jgi:DNA-binding transcriptional regulator YiaG
MNADPPERFCSLCGYIVTPEADVCPNCGGLYFTTITEPLKRSDEYKRSAIAILAKNQRRERSPHRPPLFSDREGAMRDAIRQLRSQRTRLTWTNVATELGVEEKTLRNWRDELGWPLPSDPWWTTRS